MTSTKRFRPWNTDSLAVIRRRHPGGTIEISYEHDPNRVHSLSKREADVIGRVVDRDDYRPAAKVAA